MVFETYIDAPAASRCDQSPVMMRILGDPGILDDLALRAKGPIDLPPVDFSAWVGNFIPWVKQGMDPLEIEAGIKQSMMEAGVEDPLAAIRKTYNFAHSSMNHRFHRFAGPDAVDEGLDITGHGVALPGSVINPASTPEERRMAFLAMLESMMERNCLPFREGDIAPSPVSEFSLASLVPLPIAETQPTWCGRYDVMRPGAKVSAWGSRAGGLATPR